MTRVAIIGAGIGGLATANLLAKAGFQVAIYEQAHMPGGRAGQLDMGGYRFDTGPSWYLMPEVFAHYYRLLGEDVEKHLELQRLDPAYKVFFDYAPEPLTIHADLTRDSRSFESVESGAGTALSRYLQSSERIYDLAMKNFLYTNFDRLSSLASPALIKQLPGLMRAMTQPIDGYVGHFFKDQRLRQIMEYPMVFLGTSPFEAPAMYSLMSHMDFNQGVYYPAGGLYKIIQSLVAIGSSLGVEYNYGQRVSSILTQNGRATGLSLQSTSGNQSGADSQVAADIIISNADLHFTETELLPPELQTYPERYWQKKQAGPSALLMYLGVDGKIPQLEHHNLFFTQDWQANFQAIFHDKSWPSPASIYICKPSQTDPTVAPEGCENLFVLVPAPAGLPTARAELEQLADDYLEQIATTLRLPDLKQRIQVRKIVGPDYFSASFNAWQGTALGLSHKLLQSALFRPSNKSKKVENLYYVGGSTIPGIGLPMCLIGAELLYKRVAGDQSSGPVETLEKLEQL